MPITTRDIRVMPQPLDLAVRKPVSGCIFNLWGPPFIGVTIKDYSGQGNDGTITGATRVRLASGLWVLSFDGDDYVDSATSTADSNVFTFEGWVNPTAASIAANDAIFSHGGMPVDKGWTVAFVALGGGTHGLRLTLHAVGNYDSGAGVVANVWQYVAVTLNGTALSFYRNGASLGTAVSGAMSIGTHKYCIGALPGGGGTQIYNGLQALQRVNSGVLSAAVLASHYAQERRFFGV